MHLYEQISDKDSTFKKLLAFKNAKRNHYYLHTPSSDSTNMIFGFCKGEGQPSHTSSAVLSPETDTCKWKRYTNKEQEGMCPGKLKNIFS
jgi:hypothetical protein